MILGHKRNASWPWDMAIKAFAKLAKGFGSHSRTVNYKDVIAHLVDEGHLSARFCVMTLLSCGIAILGLLLSSPAVVIGAMLISPLMGPIILFGFSLTLLSRTLALRSLLAVGGGIILAVSLASLIVWLSPLQAITPEILTRTRPNLFDLLVAIFSGIAGAYSVVLRKGETLVGVAIATALMPPLAVVGYGLATHNWVIFSGASELFMTNLLAIGLTTALVAKVFGFGPRNAGHITFWQTAIVLSVFIILSIPLGLSLKQIAAETLRASTIRATVQNYYASSDSHVYGIKNTFSDGAPTEVEALVLVPKNNPRAEATLQGMLQKALNEPIQLTLSQVPARPNQSFDDQTIKDLQSRLNASFVAETPAASSLGIVDFAAMQMEIAPLNISVDQSLKVLAVNPGPLSSPEKLAHLHEKSALVARKYAGWTLELRLSSSDLPPVEFARGSVEISDDANALLNNIKWALAASHTSGVRLVGHSDTSGGSEAINRRVALQRARAVATALNESGILTTVSVMYPEPHQIQLERENGQQQFRRVDVLLLANPGSGSRN
jgi:uncharacterized hydrophobic protein (TIGR00271 family)